MRCYARSSGVCLRFLAIIFLLSGFSRHQLHSIQAAQSLPSEENNRASTREHAAALLRKLQPTTSLDLTPQKVKTEAVRWIALSGPRITDDVLALLANFPEIQNLTIHPWPEDSNVTDKGLRHLSTIHSLEHLIVSGQGISGGGLNDLAKLPRLKTLHVTSPKLGEEDFELDGFENLQSLNLQGVVTDRQLAQVAALPRLTFVGVASRHITDEGLKTLQRLPNLTRLSLQCPQVTEKGLTIVGQLTSLCHLVLSGLEITDEGMRQLRSLTQIESFYLDTTDQVTDEGLKVFANWPRVEQLYLKRNLKVTGTALAQIPNPDSVRRLFLQGPGVNDRGLAALSSFTNVQHLEIGSGLSPEGAQTSRSEITDAGVSQLVSLSADGCIVTLTNVSITDAGLKHVAMLTGLKKLNLIRAPQVTRAGVLEAQHLSGTPISASALQDE